MENKLGEIIVKLKNSDKKLKLFIVAGLVGILIIFFSESFPASTKSASGMDDFSYEEYVISLEEETRQLLESIDGAGKCRVMLTLEDTRESVFAKNSEKNSGEGSYSSSFEYVLYKDKEGETPALIKQYFPKVKGVAVVCSGADNTVVKESIINSLSSVFDIPTSKISVSKLSR